jgi:hypothetical protein
MKHSPWGAVQHEHRYSADVVSVSTAGHGGFHAVGAARRRIDELFPTFQPWAGAGWYEEDCDWSIVAIALPELFDDGALVGAVRTVRHSTEYLAEPRTWLESADPQAVAIRGRVARFESAVADQWRTGSMGTADGYPHTHWRVSFRRVCDGAEREAVLPTYPVREYWTDEQLAAESVWCKNVA